MGRKKGEVKMKRKVEGEEKRKGEG